MKFSIIVPVYNVEDYIKECVCSVLNQTFTDFELLLVDDGSTDKSGIICDNFALKDSRIIVIHQKNAGQSSARNSGIIHAKGEYLIFLDGDDYYCDLKLLENLNCVANNIDLVVFYWKNVNDREQDIHTIHIDHYGKLNEEYEDGCDFLEAALSVNLSYPWFSWLYAFRREWWVKRGYSFPEGRIYEDANILYRVILNAKGVSVLNTVSYAYRLNRIGSSTSETSLKKEQDRLDVMIENISYVQSLCTISEKLRRLLLHNFADAYYMCLIWLYDISQKDERKIIVDRLHETEWVCRYSIDLKHKLVNFFIRILGINATALILKLRRVIRSNRKFLI